MDTKFFIYALRHPASKVIMYVGKTNNVKSRKKEHNTKKGQTKKDEWIDDLKKQGKKPIFEILEECTKYNWHEREAHHIKTKNPPLNTYRGIIKRTNDAYRDSVKDMLLHSTFFRLLESSHADTVIAKLSNDKYYILYGKPTSNYYIFINSERIFIPKQSIIYKTKDIDLPIFPHKYGIASGELFIVS